MQPRKLPPLALCFMFLPLLTIAHGLRAPVIDESNAIAAKGDIPTPDKYLSAIRTYQQEVVQQLKTTEQYVQAIADASRTGQQQKAEHNYVLAHQSYEQVRTIIRLFANADETINSRADYYLNGTDDPAFVGFHRLEYDLFARHDLPKAQSEAVNLIYKIKDLQKRVAHDEFDIAKIIQSAADFQELTLKTKLMGQENQYGHSDLADIQANIRGSAQIISHLSPFISAQKYNDLKNNNQLILAILSKYQLPHGQFQPFDQLSQQDHDQLYSLISTQAHQLAQLRAELSVPVYYKYKH